jgi:hypothetical protein
LREANSFIDCLDDCVRSLEADLDNKSQLEIWQRRLDRDHRPHDFDKIIRDVANDIGRGELDCVTFRSRYIDRWRREIGMLADGYDFQREARRLIEASLVRETMERPPITGDELMKEFNLGPGPRVGQILSLAHSLYRQSPGTKEQLLVQLREEINRTNKYVAE